MLIPCCSEESIFAMATSSGVSINAKNINATVVVSVRASGLLPQVLLTGQADL